MPADPDPLRQRLVDLLCRSGAITSAEVEAAFRKVPRHLFLPHLPPEQVYRDDAIPTRWAEGLPTSSSSQPAIMAIMAEQLELHPGLRVLEIGAGTGYNAAVLREVVGQAGAVVTVDIQPDVAEEARAHLQAAGYGDVVVITGDGGFGYAAGAPFDRIIVTASTSDLSPHWVEQLRDGGLLLVPFRIRTLCSCVSFEKRGRVLHSRSIQPCGFMNLQGKYGTPDPILPMGDGLFLSGPSARDVPKELLHELLSQPPRRVGDLIVQVNEYGLGSGLAVYLVLQESGVVDFFTTDATRWGFHAISGLLDLQAKSLCLMRRDGVVVYGSDAAAQRLKQRVEEWVHLGRPSLSCLRIEASPSGSTEEASEPPTDSPLTLRALRTVRQRWYDFGIWFEETDGGRASMVDGR